MAYRPSHAGFDLNAGSALAGVVPASLQAAVIGSGLLLVWLGVLAVMTDGPPDPLSILQIIPGVIVAGFFTVIVATVFCGFYIGLVGLPLAALLGQRLDSALGLALAVLAALVTGVAAMAVFGVWPLFDTLDWQFALLVLAYALPAGLFYRRAVLTARQLNPYADPAA